MFKRLDCDRRPKNKRYSDCWCDYPGVGKIYDTDIAAFVRKHTHWWDRLDYHKICDCAQMTFDMLAGVIPMPKKKNWYF